MAEAIQLLSAGTIRKRKKRRGKRSTLLESSDLSKSREDEFLRFEQLKKVDTCNYASGLQNSEQLIILDSISDSDSNQWFNLKSFSEKDGASINKKVTETYQQELELLKKEINRLREENLELKNELHQTNNAISIGSSPLIQVSFKKKQLAKKYKTKVESFLRDILSREHIPKVSENELDEYQDASQIQLFENFSVDISCEPELDITTAVPLYKASYNEILQESKENNEIKPLSNTRPSINCFNCLGDHAFEKCPHKLDRVRIIRNRRQFFRSVPRSSRYHIEEKQKGCFVPGVISEELRQALDLRSNQIPPYVYRMRLLGYPPGWLKEASVESSGLTMYGSDGKAEMNEETPEDGEVDVNSVRVQVDPSKLINYPGFNVPLPPEYIDESQQLGMPALQLHHLRSIVEMHMKPPDVKPSRKRKLQVPATATQSKIPRREEDMEVEEANDGGILDTDGVDGECVFIPPLPPESTGTAVPPPPPPPPPPEELPPLPEEEPPPLPPDEPYIPSPPDSAEVSRAPSAQLEEYFTLKETSSLASSGGASSPSLTDLEETKRRLMKELELSSELCDTVQSDEKSSIEAETAGPLTSPSLSPAIESNYISLAECNSESSQELDIRTSKHSTSLSVSLGTPSISCHSPYVQLPEYSKFSEGVSEHMPFENLPNAIGKYEKMKGVLHKVRQKLNALMH